MGPLISAGQREQVASFVPDDVRSRSAGDLRRLACWFPPTVLAPVSNEDRAAREEIFGPVASVIPFADEDEAVRPRTTRSGLSGSVWTGDGARALRVARAIDTGVISINSNTSVRVTTPFGGFKQSGVGRELGPDALDHYTEVKNVYYADGVDDARTPGRQGLCDHGAASGIGAESARVFSEEGARVAAVDLEDSDAARSRSSPT